MQTQLEQFDDMRALNEPGYISECANPECGYEVGTGGDAYKYCPLCGQPFNTWEEAEEHTKGKKVYSAS